MSLEEYELLYRFSSHMSPERRAKFFDEVFEIVETRYEMTEQKPGVSQTGPAFV